jgi:hypothetical protein
MLLMDSDAVAEAELERTTFSGWLCVFTVVLGKTNGLGGVGVTMTACADAIVAFNVTVSGV